MTLALLIALPFLGAGLPLLAERYGRSLCAVAAALAPLLALGLLLGQAGAVIDGARPSLYWPWLPQLGLNFSLRLDGLALLFALLILGIGLLVILYARYYLSKSESHGALLCLSPAVHGGNARGGVVIQPVAHAGVLGADQPFVFPAHWLLGAA